MRRYRRSVDRTSPPPPAARAGGGDGPELVPLPGSSLRWGWVFAGIWLVYLVNPLLDAARADGWPRRVAGVAAVLGFGVLYVRTWSVSRATRRRGEPMPVRFVVRVLVACAVCVVVATLTAGESALAMLVFVATIAMFLLPLRPAVAVVAALVGVVLAVPRVVPGWTPQDAAAGGVVFAALAMFGILASIRRNAELVAAQREIAALALVNERSRFARDLHDILGHSLTVLTVKAELAGRLLDVGTADTAAKARAEVADLERLAREALADVRSAVTGYREVTLVAELASARAALDAAGIEADLPTVVQDVPADRRELFGWAVREGVTNVVRHSRARRCTIVVGPDAVEVVDDGAGTSLPAGASGGSSGLAGLRERAAALGASVVAETVAGGGFRLRVGW